MEKLLPDIAANSMGSAVAAERYRPYPAYRDSGVEWLGDIPEHWDVKRLKEFATVQLSNVDKKTADDEDAVQLCNYVDVYYNHKIGRPIEFMPSTATPSQIRRFSLRTGDVLITKDSETWTDIAVPAVVMEDLPGVLCGYHLAHIRPHEKHDGFFLAHCIAAVGPRDQYHVAANGITRFGLTGDAIRNGTLAIPPLVEQRRIAAFLDFETEKVDALVAKKERLIELLQEKRIALITRAVTKGIDPDAPMKDSGVEWMGEIPKHWEIKRVAELALTLQTGPFGSQLHAAEYIIGGIPLINPANLISGTLVPDMGRTVDEVTATRLAFHKLLQGDILFARRGDVGRCGLVGEQQEGWLCGTGCLRMRPCPRSAESSYLLYLLSTQGVGDWLANESVGSTMQNLNTSIIGGIPVAVPSLAEQRRISEFLDRETTKVDALLAKIHEAIDRLKELRTALIAAAVTGKIDVRETPA